MSQIKHNDEMMRRDFNGQMKTRMKMHLKSKLTWQAMIQEGSDIRKAICKTVQANYCVKVNG